ncbi:MAG: TonB-dependent siderophore receptor [Pyrinomonadaceae bacterium]
MFSRATTVLNSILLLTSCLPPASPPCVLDNQGKVLLRGRVVDPDRAAIPGATVQVSSITFPSSPAITTDEKGQFALSLVPGDYRLKVTASGFAEISQPLHLTIAAEDVTIQLPLAQTFASVTITDNAGYGIGAVSTATKTYTLLRDLPQSITVITKVQMQDQAMQSVADVVNYIPGVTSHQGENNRDQVVIRGNSTSADFFLNGVRDDVQYYRDLYNVDRVEALKGPNSMTFGRGGGGGVINRVTKEAGFAASREIVVRGGSFGNKRLTMDLNQPVNERLALRLNGVYERSGSFRRFVDLERNGLNPTLTVVVDPNTSITSSYEWFNDRRVADRGIPSFHGRPVDVPVDTFFGNPNDSHVGARVNLASVAIAHQHGGFEIRNRLMFADYRRHYQNFVPGAVTLDKTAVTLSAYNNATNRRNLFDQTDVIGRLKTGVVGHTVLTGVELGRQRTMNRRNTGFFDNAVSSIHVALDNPVIDIPVTFRPNPTDADNRLKTNLAATYVQDQMELSRRFQIVTGIRLDYFGLNFHNNRTGENLRRIDRLISPRAGLIFKPFTAMTLYGNYSVAYLPSSGDQFSSLTSVTQQVKPEKFSNYEAGTKWDIKHNLAFTAALYRQNRTNTRATDPNNPTRILQTGSQQTNGFEAGINGSVTGKWRIAGGYAYQNAFIASATVSAREGAQVGLVPHQTFSLWNNYNVLKRVGAGFGLLHRSDMYAAVDNTVVLPGYTRADAAIYFFINEHWHLQANMQNLFNSRYYLNADGNNNISPGSPRAVRLSLSAKF